MILRKCLPFRWLTAICTSIVIGFQDRQPLVACHGMRDCLSSRPSSLTIHGHLARIALHPINNARYLWTWIGSIIPRHLLKDLRSISLVDSLPISGKSASISFQIPLSVNGACFTVLSPLAVSSLMGLLRMGAPPFPIIMPLLFASLVSLAMASHNDRALLRVALCPCLHPKSLISRAHKSPVAISAKSMRFVRQHPSTFDAGDNLLATRTLRHYGAPC